MPKKKHKKPKNKNKVKKSRSWAAVVAWFRNSAGPIKDKKKEKSKKKCRNKKIDD
jgi:hypothetical protein